MNRLIGVPWIVHHFSATMIVGTHGKQIFLCQIHHPLGFVLIVGSTIGVGSIIEVREVTVEVNVVAIIAFGTSDGVIATVISTIRVGARENKQIDIVEDVLDATVGAGAELIDESKHKNHARHLITVHR